MLFVALLTGAWIGMVVGGRGVDVLLFAAAGLSLFCLRTPVESVAGSSPVRAVTREERLMAWRFIVIFGVLATIAIAWLFIRSRATGLAELGAVVGVALLAQVAVKRLGRKGRMPSQVIGALALTSAAPGAYYAATGHFDVRALGLWFANWVFAGNQIHFVQLRLRASRCQSWEEKFARGSGFFFGQMLMMLLLAGAWAYGIVPGLVLLAFLPAFLRGLVWFFSPAQPLVLHRLGMTELAYSVVFGALLIMGLH